MLTRSSCAVSSARGVPSVLEALLDHDELSEELLSDVWINLFHHCRLRGVHYADVVLEATLNLVARRFAHLR